MKTLNIKKNSEEITCNGLKIKSDTEITKIESWGDLSRLQEGQIIMASMPARIWKPEINNIFFYFDGTVCVGPDLDWPGRLYPFLTKLLELKKDEIFYFSLDKFHVKYGDIEFENGKLICQPLKGSISKKSVRKITSPYATKNDGSKYVMFNDLPDRTKLGIENYKKINKLMMDIEI